MTALSDWLHALPNSHTQALRDFRRMARAKYPNEPDYLAKALDSGNLAELLRPAAHHTKKLSPAQEAAVISAMPREFVISLHH